MNEAFVEQGVRLPLLILGWSTLALFVIAVICVVVEIRRENGEGGGIVVAVACTAGGLVCAVTWAFMMIPYDGKYQHYYEVQGHVDSVSNVLSDADGDLTRQPVLMIAGIDQPIVVDDPRAVSLQDRDVTLRCTVGWHYNAADTYECKIANYGTVVQP
jgi:hypothetical protein